MGIFDGLLKDGVSAVGSAVGGLARDVRAAISGKEVVTAEERIKILDNMSKMETLALQADQAINEGQMKINEIEALSADKFSSRWRPLCGYICALGLFYQFLIMPVFPWIIKVGAVITHHNSNAIPVLPSLDTSTLLPLLFGMLGLGAMRSVERIKGVIPQGK
jgi:hypothetical protein